MIVLCITTGVYLLLIGAFIVGFDKVSTFTTHNKQPGIGFSIVIPFRNEAHNLPGLLESLNSLQYPENQFECILVNDASEDNSQEIIHHYLKKTTIDFTVIQVHRKSTSPKKDAIDTAIDIAKFDWIITTDADCILPSGWLKTFADFIHNKTAKMVVGPVTYSSIDHSFLHQFQVLDFLSLQGATIGSFGIGKPFLCNGANLAYEKQTFIELKGFQGNNHIASGDDIFLFEKFYKAYPSQVHFLKSTSAIISTLPVQSWTSLIQQRMRWSAKSSSYHLVFGKIVGFIVLAMNLIYIASLFGLFVCTNYFVYSLSILVSKIVIDFLLIQKAFTFYLKKRINILHYIPGSLFYPFFSILIVLRTLMVNYHWKGRTFKR